MVKHLGLGAVASGMLPSSALACGGADAAPWGAGAVKRGKSYPGEAVGTRPVAEEMAVVGILV